MGKVKQQHRVEWENETEFKGWLKEGKKNNSYCVLCCVEIRSHHADISKHAKTLRHKGNRDKITKQPSIRNYGTNVSSNLSKRQEIILSSFVACHTSILTIDHLTDIINNFINEQQPATRSRITFEELRLHRTKCTAVIKRVIAPCLLNKILADVGDSKFSLICDESTDVSTEKYLCICIKYYSKTNNEIVTQFLSFLRVIRTTSDELYNTVYDFLKSIGLKMKNILGLGTDGANNMCGQYNSLFSLIKERDSPNLILVKCVCHSLHLSSSKASEVFHDEVDYLLRETYSWFKNSDLRMAKYKEIFQLINVNENSQYSKLTQLSATRWLSRYKAVEKILAQYLELETFFPIEAQKERCHSAKILADLFKNKGTDIDFYKGFDEINTLIWSLARQIMKPSLLAHLQNKLEKLANSLQFDQNFLQHDIADLGYEFEIECNTLNLTHQELIEVRNKCVQFIKILLQELIKRMPQHLEIFKTINYFSPNIILNPVRPTFSELPLQLANQDKISDIQTQYRNLLNIHWADVFDEIPVHPHLFWKKVTTLTNAAGELCFRDLAEFAFTLLSLPSSNAVVERCFSVMNIVKSKIRNRMQLELLNSIVTIRTYFSVNKICCKTFCPSSDMLKYNSSIYDTKTSTSDTDDGEWHEIFDLFVNL